MADLDREKVSTPFDRVDWDRVRFIRFARMPVWGLLADNTDRAWVTWLVSVMTVESSDIAEKAIIDSIEFAFIRAGSETARLVIRFATEAT